MIKRTIVLILFLLACSISAAAQTATINYTFTKFDGVTPDTEATVSVYEVVQNNGINRRDTITYKVDSSGRLLDKFAGTIGMKLPRNSVVRMRIDAAGFSDTNAGVWYVIPDSATASLSSLERWVTGTYYLTATNGTGFNLRAPSITTGNVMGFTIPNSGFTGSVLKVQKVDGTVIFNIDANGTMTVGSAAFSINTLTEDLTPASGDYVMTYDVSAGQHKKVLLSNLPGGGGGASITVEEVDGTPSVPSVTTFRFDQADGFAVSTPGAGIVKIDLANVPYAALALTGAIVNADLAAGIDAAKVADGSVSNAEFQFINTLTSNAQTQINARLTQAAADLLYSALAHNHSGVYEPADADLSAIAGLSPTNDDILQRKAGAWTNRTPAQFKVDLALVKADVGLANVDNTSDANKPISTATQAALDLKAPLASPTFTGTVTIPTPFMLGAVSVLPTGTELNFVDGVTSPIQTQLDGKAATNLVGSPCELVIAVSDESTAITTGTAKVTFRMPYGMTLTGVRASLNVASSSGTPTVDINEGGTTILSTKLTIDANEKTSQTAATPAVISDATLADDAEITIDIDVAGTGAKGLKVVLIGTRN